MLISLKKTTTEQCKDSGLALALICLLCYQAWGFAFLPPAAISALLAAMIFPTVFKPFALFWFGLSAVLGTFVPRVILTILFFVLVFPVGLARRLIGKDPMRVNDWRKGRESVFRTRNHRFSAEDLDRPY